MKISNKILQNMYDEIGLDKISLYAALREMCPKALKTKQQKDMWKHENPTTQACYFIAEWLYYYITPKGTIPYKIKVPGDPGLHRFLRLPSGKVIDIAAEQFDNYEEIDYNKAKVCYFMQTGGKGPSKRARKLNELYEHFNNYHHNRKIIIE